MDARLAFPFCCCTPSTVPPKTTNTHCYSIVIPISQYNTSNGDNIHFPFTICFEDQDMMLHVLRRERKWILPLIWLNFTVLSPRPKLSVGEIARLLFGFFFLISRVLGLQIRRGRIHWKANTPNFYEIWSLNFIVLGPKSPLERGDESDQIRRWFSIELSTVPSLCTMNTQHTIVFFLPSLTWLLAEFGLKKLRAMF